MAHIGVARAATGEAAPWIARVARMGYAAKALLYGTVGVFAIMAGLRLGGATTDSQGAMQVLQEVPLGGVMVGMVAVGLLGYAAWRILEGILDPERRGTGFRALAIRAGYILRGLGHAALALTALAVAFRGDNGAAGGGGNGGADQGREATQAAFALPGGSALVWAAAIGIAAYGAYQVYRAFAADIAKHIDETQVERTTGRWVIAVSRFGIAARGVVFLAIGWMASLAARNHDASRTGGIGEALDVIRRFGEWPFIAVAAGLVAYGVFQLLNAKYRHIRLAS